MMKLKVVQISVGALCLSACSEAAFKMVDDGNYNSAGIRVASVTQDVNVSANRQVDILFVVDNSKSMKDEQANFSAKINGFMSLIQDLDWHVALTTTDGLSETLDSSGVSRDWSDGRFRPFDSDTGTRRVLKAGETSLADAQTQLARAIEVGLLGSGEERAINATYRAIERIGDTGANADFFRPHARLAVIAISDEDECSDAKCLAKKPTSVPDNLVSLVRSTWGLDKVFTFNSIARMASDTQCTTAKLTPTYELMSSLTDGVTGSVCASDYTSVLTRLGTRVVELVDSVQLACLPEDMTGDGVGDISVIHSDGTRQTTGFKIEGRLVTFESALPEGIHRFEYHCNQ